MSHDPQSPSDAADHVGDYDGMILPHDHDTGQHYCPECGEPCDGPNVEAFETLDIVCCDECAEAHFEENGQFGVGA